jgi:hypothetical protein
MIYTGLMTEGCYPIDKQGALQRPLATIFSATMRDVGRDAFISRLDIIPDTISLVNRIGDVGALANLQALCDLTTNSLLVVQSIAFELDENLNYNRAQKEDFFTAVMSFLCRLRIEVCKVVCDNFPIWVKKLTALSVTRTRGGFHILCLNRACNLEFSYDMRTNSIRETCKRISELVRFLNLRQGKAFLKGQCLTGIVTRWIYLCGIGVLLVLVDCKRRFCSNDRRR